VTYFLPTVPWPWGRAKMSTRNIPGTKGDRCLRLTTSPFLRAEFHEIWEPKSPGILWATPGLLQDSFCLYIVYRQIVKIIIHSLL